MNVDLFIKKVPQVVKELISREATQNRRSINQEAIALLEEAPLCALAAIVTATPAAALPVSTRLAALEALSWLALRTGSSEAALRADWPRLPAFEAGAPFDWRNTAATRSPQVWARLSSVCSSPTRPIIPPWATANR